MRGSNNLPPDNQIKVFQKNPHKGSKIKSHKSLKSHQERFCGGQWQKERRQPKVHRSDYIFNTL